MTNNLSTQLPVEVVDKIEQEAHNATSALYSPNNYDEFTSFRSGWEKGATAYATKWFTCFEESNKMAGDFADSALKMQELQKENDKLNQQATGWRPLLEEVLHDWDSMVFEQEIKDKIKKFLYGE